MPPAKPNEEVLTVYLRGALAEEFRAYVTRVHGHAKERGVPAPSKTTLASIAVARLIRNSDPNQLLLDI